MQTLTVIGRRWFDRRAGNTYHSVRCIVDGKDVGGAGMTYGYGDHYLQTAADILERDGHTPGREHYAHGGAEPLWLYCRERGIEFTYSASDVGRKRDL